MASVRLIKHEAVPKCGSSEVRLADGAPSGFFYWDDIPWRPVRPAQMNRPEPSPEPSAIGFNFASPWRPDHAYLIFVLVAVVPTFAVDQAWAAGDLPAFDIVKNCKAEDAGTDTGTKACTTDETNAKSQLAKNWSSYSASAKKECIGEASIGGDNSYVELLTCLEMTTGKFEKQ